MISTMTKQRQRSDVVDDGNDSDGGNSNVDGHSDGNGNGDDDAAAANGDNVDDDNGGIQGWRLDNGDRTTTTDNEGVRQQLWQ